MTGGTAFDRCGAAVVRVALIGMLTAYLLAGQTTAQATLGSSPSDTLDCDVSSSFCVSGTGHRDLLPGCRHRLSPLPLGACVKVLWIPKDVCKSSTSSPSTFDTAFAVRNSVASQHPIRAFELYKYETDSAARSRAPSPYASKHCRSSPSRASYWPSAIIMQIAHACADRPALHLLYRSFLDDF